MKKAILLLCMVSALCGRTEAQSVVSATGSSTDMMTWTLGEVFTESIMRSNVVRFSQGFNQPFTISTSGILNVKGDNLTFTAGPNPVVDELYISVSGSRSTAWSLYDLQGRMLDSGELTDTQAVISFSDKNAGEYVLRIKNEAGSRSILIIKK